MNTALRDAVDHADMTVGKLARKASVTVKTAERWLSDPTRVPHPRTRVDVETALGVSPDVLWPKVVRSTIKTGPDREIVSAYPYRIACPTSVWADLIDGASQSICFAGYTNYFLWQEHPRLADRLKRKGEDGCSVRFVLGDPESEVTRRREEVEAVPLTVSTRIRITLDALDKLREAPGIEAKYSDDHIALSVFAFDDQMRLSVPARERQIHLRECAEVRVGPGVARLGA